MSAADKIAEARALIENPSMVRCNQCVLLWTEDDLIVSPDAADGGLSRHCPQCGTDHHLMDVSLQDAAAALADLAEALRAEIARLKARLTTTEALSWPPAHRISDFLEPDAGFWKSCSGCHETNEGYPTGAFHPGLGCNIGTGCSECGGIGAVWDNTDYSGFADFLDTNQTEVARLTAERDAAEARGAERMREQAARLCEGSAQLPGWVPRFIRALPLTKEDADVWP